MGIDKTIAYTASPGLRGDGYSTAGLRDDARQWLIYQDPQMGAVMRAIEIAALSMAISR